MSRNYSKSAVLDLVEIGVPIARVAREHGVSRQTIYYWLKQKGLDSNQSQANDQAGTTNGPITSDDTASSSHDTRELRK